jgi:dynein heavy chain
VTGLEKLEFAASQVSVMQEELTALQPELIQTSAETEKLMVKIEQDTVEVEAKKEVRPFKIALFILDRSISSS